LRKAGFSQGERSATVGIMSWEVNWWSLERGKWKRQNAATEPEKQD